MAADVPSTAVSVRGLTHRYGDRVALSDVSFDVERGAMFALLGPNGGGKTTLFRILCTLMRPTSGTAVIMGSDVVAAPRAARRHLGVTFQSPSVDRKLTVGENLMHHGHLYGMRGRDLRRRIEAAVEAVDLSDRRRERVERLSGGMSRRVEIAKCLLHAPQVLLMDEPSTGLDPTARRSLRDQLEKLRVSRGMTCLLTTHLMDEAESCDRVAILDQGRLVAHETPAALKASVGGDVVTVVSDRPDELADELNRRSGIRVRREGGVLRVEHERGHELAGQLAQTYGRSVSSITVGRPTLDDVFAHLTGHRLEDGA